MCSVKIELRPNSAFATLRGFLKPYQWANDFRDLYYVQGQFRQHPYRFS